MKIGILLTTGTVLFLAASGCVGVKHERAPQSWPKPISASEVKQFDGIFSNRSIDPKTGQPGDQSAQLFDFLTGRGHSLGKLGWEVEIRSTSDGSLLHVRLLDEQELEIASADLQRGADFELSRGFLSLHGPSSGTHATSTNLGTGIRHQSFQLYISSTSDLLGRQSDSAAGLLFYFVPVATDTKDCMLWPKIVSK